MGDTYENIRLIITLLKVIGGENQFISFHFYWLFETEVAETHTTNYQNKQGK